MASEATSLRLEDLAFIEKRLKVVTTSGEFTHLQAQLNTIERSAQQSSPHVQAHFYLLRGALKIKAVSLGQHHWKQSQADQVLQEALLLLEKAQTACDNAVQEAGGWTESLSGLQQRCAYEACVATTHLLSLGHQPGLVFDTSRLDTKQHRNYSKALRYRLRLRSSF